MDKLESISLYAPNSKLCSFSQERCLRTLGQEYNSCSGCQHLESYIKLLEIIDK